MLGLQRRAGEGRPWPGLPGPRRASLHPPVTPGHSLMTLAALGELPHGLQSPSSLSSLFSVVFLSFLFFLSWEALTSFPQPALPNTPISPRRTPQADLGPFCLPRAGFCPGRGLPDLGGGEGPLCRPGEQPPHIGSLWPSPPTPGAFEQFPLRCPRCQAVLLSRRTRTARNLRGFKEAAFSAMKSHGREASPCSGGSQSPWKVKKRMPVWGQGVCITIPPLPFNRERSCGLQAPRSSPPFNFLLACDRNWFIFMFTFTFHV